MKKVLMTLIVALGFCGSIFAQNYESHWPDFYGPAFDFQTPLVAAIQIDGQIITSDYEGWDALEVAFFVGDECRGSGSTFPDAVPFVFYLYNGYVEEYGDPFPVIDGAALYYNDGGEEATVKIYDHLRGIEYTECVVTLAGEPYTILTGADNDQGWYDPENPIMLNFTSPAPPTPETHYWDDPNTWESGSVPDSLAPVTLTNNVIIGANDTVYAGNVNLNGFTLTMEPGAEFYHTNEIDMIIQMNVDGYQATRDENPDNDGYRLIASPVYESSNNPSIAIPEAMLEGNYDLYYFDQTQDFEWINHKLGNDQYQFTTLDLGKGYLYANTEDVFVVFAGQTLPTSIPMPVSLTYEENAHFPGWNLVGNPYTAKAYADRAYYVLDAEGDEVISAELGEGIAPMKGFFVEAGSAEDLTCTVSTTPQNNNTGSLNINLSQANTLADRAIVNFGEGKTLGKFQLNPNHTKVFIPQEGKDYAVVSAGDKGEMPVSFKAEKSGTYTMSLSSQNISFSYLHLIDNKTGQDIDMLATPAYTFNAQTTDYASRFRLVFATDNSVNSDSFGFVNNSGNFCVYGIEGKATLQVFDVLGHMLSSETFSGSIEKKVNAATGVYMMRLINGNDVKVQKVIIK